MARFQREFSSLSLSFFCFGSLCRTPKGTWIGAIRVEGEHLVIEFTCGCRFMVQTVEIPNVVLCRCNMLRTIGIFGMLMARNHQTDGWDVKRRGMVGIGEPIVYDDQFLPFYFKLIAVKCFGHNEGFRNLSWETGLPEVFQVIWIDLRVHRFSNSRRCNGSCMRKLIQ